MSAHYTKFITTFSSFLTCLYVKNIWACKTGEGLLDHVSFNIKFLKLRLRTQPNTDHNLINRCTLHPNHNHVTTLDPKLEQQDLREYLSI